MSTLLSKSLIHTQRDNFESMHFSSSLRFTMSILPLIISWKITEKAIILSRPQQEELCGKNTGVSFPLLL